MSLTSEINKKSDVYNQIYTNLDITNVENILQYANNLQLYYSAIDGEQFSLCGMSVIYAIREYLFGKDSINNTIASGINYTPNFGNMAVDAVCNAMRDSFSRKKCTPTSLQNLISPDIKPTLLSVQNIIESFPETINNLRGLPYRVNPTFNLSRCVGGADANYIIGDTIFQTITSIKRNPLTLEKIIQPIGYYMLDDFNEYKLKKISWYLTRQKTIITCNISYLVWDLHYKFKSEKLSNVICGETKNNKVLMGF